MKQKQIKQLTLTFQSLGMTLQDVAQATERLSRNSQMRKFETLLIGWGYRKRCVMLARALAQQSDPFIKEIIWKHFKKES